MASLIIAKTVEQALRDHAAGKTYDVNDSKQTGLVLRVRSKDIRWCVRAMWRRRQQRFDIGGVVAGNENADGRACLATARSRAAQIRELCKAGTDPAEVLAFMLGGHKAVVAQRQAEAEALTWDWEEATAAYFVHVELHKRPDTLRDYRNKLKKFDAFAGRPVAGITSDEISRIIKKVNDTRHPVTDRRNEAMAAGCTRVVKAFWGWMRDASRRTESGVTIDLDDVSPPDRIPVQEGNSKIEYDPTMEKGQAPPAIELGRALAIARSGALTRRVGLGIELLMASVQRRRAVVGAHRQFFKMYPERPGEIGWYVPPYFRKTTKRGSRAHLVPLLGFGADAVRGLMALSDDPNAAEKNAHFGWLLPGRGRENDQHADTGLLNDILEVMPGVDWSPHGVRYAFADFVNTLEGFKYSDADVLLDHMEGVEPDNVTGMFYASNPDIARKRRMMTAWVAYLDDLCAQAIAEDAHYADANWIRQQIYVKRYPDRVARRIAIREAKKLSVWGPEQQRR